MVGVACLCFAVQIRRRNGIVSDSKVKILAAESDLYVAEIGESVVLKLGPRWVTGTAHTSCCRAL